MRNTYILPTLLVLLFLSGFAQAQNNDECVSATELNNVTNWCSQNGEFNNNSATQSNAPPVPNCFSNAASNDVWFTFIAQATTVNISVAGASGQTGGGTLTNPELALYEGQCGNLILQECISDALGDDIIETFLGPLDIGERYFIRVSSRNGGRGTFKLCVNNFNDVPQPSGDCEPGVVLCDKSSFTVAKVTGAGNNRFEIDGNTCLSIPAGCGIAESSSSWYKWICETPGSLSFDITPLNPSDDIDFVVFELPNGIEDCSGKQSLRCMFSGENQNSDISTWIDCTGATGLVDTDGDDSESCGCQPGNNNYARSIQMQAGRAYALMIMNFSNTGNGFTINFGGTGTFMGPRAAIQVDGGVNCFGTDLRVEDVSTSATDNIVRRVWDFGLGATPRTSTDRVVTNVQWDKPGIKNIVLTVETSRGCLVTDIFQVTIDPCCETVNKINATLEPTELFCWYDSNGIIDLEASSAAPPLSYSWSTGATTEDIFNLKVDTYTVTILNAAGCELEAGARITSPPPIALDFDIVKPTCDGGKDGELTVLPSGGTPSYTYSFDGSPFSSTVNSIDQIPVGLYNVRVRDANNCMTDTTVFVNELVLEIDSLDRVITPPSCFGFSDGSIEVAITNGLAPYQYDFMDGRGFTFDNTLGGLPDTIIIVEVRDANNCEGRFELVIQEPPPLAVDLFPTEVSCFRAEDGAMAAVPSGGVGGYSYLWSTNGVDSLIVNLDTGIYILNLTDANGCELIDQARIIEPPLLEILDIDPQAVRCFTDTNGVFTISASGGSPGYVYFVEGGVPSQDAVITDLSPGQYTVFVEDSRGCRDSVISEIESPPPLIIDAGPDQMVELGYEVLLPTTLSPAGWPVTYSWLPLNGSLDCTDCDRPLSRPPRTTVYTVAVTDTNGCVSIDSVTVFVEIVRPIFIPNIISPNEDGVNDIFTLTGSPAATQIDELTIFNRWGGRVYSVNNIPVGDPMNGWDGTFKDKFVDPGVFVYMAKVRFLDDVVLLYKGSITVVR